MYSRRIRTVFFGVIVLAGFLSADFSGAAGERNADIAIGGPPGMGDIRCLGGIEGTDTLYLGTSTGLYRSTDLGGAWAREDLANGNMEARGIAFSNGYIFIAGETGVYLNDGSGKWRLVTRRKDLLGVTPEDRGKKQGPGAIVWTRDGLYSITQDGDVALAPLGGTWDGIKAAVHIGKNIYVAEKYSIFTSSDWGGTWKKCFSSGLSAEDDREEYGEEEKEEVEDRSGMKKLHVSENGKIIAVSGEGVFFMRVDNNDAARLDTFGIPALAVSDAVGSGDMIFVSAGHSVFKYSRETGRWEAFFETVPGGNINFLNATKGSGGRLWLWALTGKGIYRKEIGVLHCGVTEGKNEGIKKYHVSESGPSILEVQKNAIRYAETSPEKIAKWRRGAEWKAVMPRISLGFSESVDDNIDIYKSATTSYIVRGPRKTGSDWSVDLIWDLSDLIWNDAQTSIDVRSKLMVQLRGEILEDVTRLYFERKRLIAALNGPDTDGRDLAEKAIRLEELTAYIDALTGGWFSRAVSGSEVTRNP